MGTLYFDSRGARRLLLILALCTLASSRSARASSSVALDREAALAQLQTIGTRIESARAAAHAGGPDALARLDALLVEAAHATMALQQSVLDAPSSTGASAVAGASPVAPNDDDKTEQAAEVPPGPSMIMLLPSFQALMMQMSREPFDSDKQQVLREGLGPAALTSPMALRLIAAFKYSDGRLAVLKLLAPRMVDRPTRYQIEQLFPLIGDQERARKILGIAG